jgi:ribosome-associated toxin RatA of RatAB toxin-antitoxin module
MFNRWCFPFLALALMMMSPGGARGRSLSDDVRLEQGEVLLYYERSPRSDLHEVVGHVIFDAPISLVWQVITDYHHYVDFLPDLEGSHLLRRDGPQVWQYLRYPNFWPLPGLECTLLILEDEQEARISFQMISGDYVNYYGSWRLEEYRNNPERTLAIYKLLTDPGTPVPSWSKDWGNRGLVWWERDSATEKEINPQD